VVESGLGNPLVVTVTDLYGNPVSGVVVNFSAPGSGASGTLTSSTATTGSNGQAVDTLVANSVAGSYTVTASVTGISNTATFNLTNTAGAAANLAARSGFGQTAAVGGSFGNPLVVLVTDQYGNPVAGATVNFAAPSSGASANLTSASVTTGANGLASDTLTANTAAGSYSVTASVAGVAALVPFTLTNTAGVASSITVSSGSGQSSTAGSAFASALVATVTDIYGNPVSGVSVSFSAPGSGASATLAGASVTTGNNGQASDAVTAGTVAGSYAVTASVAGISAPANFSLTNTAGTASTISVVSGSGQSATVGVAFSGPLVVAVTDQFGNPLSGVTVSFSAPGSGASASLANATVTTGANGQASDTATAGTVSGAYGITATVAGAGTPASFALTNTAGAASKVVFGQQPTNATAGVAITPAPTVDITDAFGNIVTANNSTVTLTLSSGTFSNGSTTATATAASGVATFNGMVINTTGTYTLKATDGSLTSATSNSLTIGAAAASKLIFGQQPTNAVAGVAISPVATVKVEDAFGNVVTTNSSTVTLTLSSGTFSNGSTTATATASSGTATFSSLVINTSGTYTLAATDGSLTSATSSSFTISAAAARKLAFGQQPTNTTAGVTISPAVTVNVEDAFGNVVTGNNSTVTVTLSSGTFSNFSRTATATAASGVATFSSLVINNTGTYTLAATDGTLTGTTSSSFAITPAPTKLAFGQQPTNATAGVAISPAVTVKVEDVNGNVVTGNSSTVTLTLSSGTFSNGSTTATATAVNGVATFSGLVINAAGSYTLKATDGALTSATSNSLTISPAAASKLVFTQQPTNATAGVAISPAVAVKVEDAFGNVVTSNNSTVTITLSSGTFSNGSRTATATAVNGTVTFSNLVINTAGTYTLAATDGSLTGATSNSLTISAAAASKLVFGQQPTNTRHGSTMSPAVTVFVEDAFGNVCTTNNSTVTLTLSSNSFSNGSRTVTVSAVNGVATFNSLIINAIGSNYSLNATDGALTNARSNTFSIT
jgi:adhesin/invasin